MSEYRDPELRFAYDFDETAQDKAKARGHLSNVQVRFKSGLTYRVCFHAKGPLWQILAYEHIPEGKRSSFVAEPGMIVIREITLARMQRAVEELSKEKGGFFDGLRPMG
jgi:hypothetical protein